MTHPDWLKQAIDAMQLDGNVYADVDGVTDEITVHQHSVYLPVSCCVLTDSTGVNHCQHEPPPRPPWHRRLRWRIQSRWSALRMRVGSWIAGVDLDREDDW